jgi:hypothetical protein
VLRTSANQALLRSHAGIGIRDEHRQRWLRLGGVVHDKRRLVPDPPPPRDQGKTLLNTKSS